MITHSYIGQQPVYSETLRCHIYPMPDYEPPEFMKLPAKQYKGEFKRGPRGEYSTNGKNHEKRNRVIAWLRNNGPATCRVIAEQLEIDGKHVENCFRNNGNTLFFVLGVAEDGHNSYIYGLEGQTLDDMTVNCDVVRFPQLIADALRKLGEARCDELAKAMGANIGKVRFYLSTNKDLFTYKRIGSTEYLWRLKEAA